MKLNYKAVSSDGKSLRGIIEAKDVEEAAKYLRSKKLIPVHITPKSDFQLSLGFLGTSKKDVVFFTRQLSSMLTAGLTLMQSLRTLQLQMSDGKLKNIIGSVVIDIEDGNSFASALQKFPDTFDDLYVALIRAGESSGQLDKLLGRLADNLEKQQSIASQVKGALLYPIIVLIGMALVMVVIMVVVIPQLTPVYNQLHVQLPLPTLIVVYISNFMIHFWYILLIAIAVVTIAFMQWKKTQTGKILLDTIVLKLPVFGKLVHDTIITEVTRTLGLLSGAGILVVDALKQSADVANNIVYKNAILAVAKNVEKGVSVGESMSYSSLFPPIVVEMVKVGEQTGKLDDSLTRVSAYYEQEVDARVKALTTLMEPFIIVFLGAGVGFLMLAVISPIYSLINNIPT